MPKKSRVDRLIADIKTAKRKIARKEEFLATALREAPNRSMWAAPFTAEDRKRFRAYDKRVERLRVGLDDLKAEHARFDGELRRIVLATE